MNKTAYIILGFVFLVLVVLGGKMASLSEAVKAQAAVFESERAVARDSLMLLQRRVDSLKQQTPGLGEYMSAIQLHVSKLWFAAKASNWGLAGYELNELGEAIEGARLLHAVRDSVNVSGVLESVSNTQIQMLKQSIQKKERNKFLSNYSQTLAACNSCHRSAGYGFIHIVIPASPPVTNQRWEMSAE